ncbi:MAG: VPLPA-CTERM sorting domain-containing protein [Pseudomonadota bacterium]
MKTLLKSAAIAAVGLCLPLMAQATTVSNTGTYVVSDRATGDGILTHGLVRDGNGDYLGGAYQKWSVDNRTSRWTLNSDGTASLSMTGTNLADSSLSVSMDLTMNINDSDFNGVCMGYVNNDCTLDRRHRPVFDTSDWQYFDILSGSMTVSSTLESVTWALTDKNPARPTQFGDGANAFDRGVNPNDLGLSAWYDLKQTTKTGEDPNYSFIPSFSGSNLMHTDINLNVAPVPLPAGLVLMIGALGATGLVRRKARAA